MTLPVLGVPHLLVLLAAVFPLAMTVWALVTTLRATDVMPIEKLIWSAILVLFPGVGLIVWALVWFTRKRVRTTR